jgi:hypothetical protein
MPFKSESQRKYLWANHPEIAKRWADKYGNKAIRQKAIRKLKENASNPTRRK